MPGELPPSPGGARHPRSLPQGSSRHARNGSISLREHIRLRHSMVGGGPTVWAGVPVPAWVEQELPLMGTAPALSRAQGARPGPTGGLAAGHTCPFDRATHGAAPRSVAGLPGQGSQLHPACLDPSGCFGRTRWGGTVPSENAAVIPGRRKAAPFRASVSPPSMGLSCRAVLRAQGAAGTSAGRETTTHGAEAAAWQLQTGSHPSPRRMGPQT